MQNEILERNLPPYLAQGVMDKSRWPLVVSLLLGVVAFISSWWMSSPWCDELTFVDSGVNFLRTGHWQSNVFYLVNNPLFSLVAGMSVLVFGASHQSVVFVNCLFAFLASWVVLRELRRRNLISSTLHEAVLLFLYWGGWTFSGIVLNGRPDTMVLFFTAVLLGQVFPADGRRVRLVRVFLSAFALMLTAAYTLPLCALLSAFGVIRWASRRIAFWRTFWLVSGGVAAWSLIAAFYAWHREVVRFLGFYAAFNSITGERFGTFAEMALDAYTYDIFALVLVLSVLAAALAIRALRTRMLLFGSLVALAVPFLMVCCGRYRPYYSWLFHVPAVALAAILCARAGRRASVVALVCAFAVWAGNFARIPSGVENRRRVAAAERFVEAHKDCFTPGQTVVVADDTLGDVSLYYPLLSRKVDLWFRGRDALTSLTDEKKFEKGLSLFVKDADRRREMLSRVLAFQNVMPVLPERGFVVFTSERNREEVMPLVEGFGMRLSCVASNGGFSLYRACRSMSQKD